MTLDKKTVRNVFIGVGCCILLYWILHETERVKNVIKTVWGVLSPFAVGAALAFIMNVPMRAIERWLLWIKREKLRRWVAIILTFSVVILILCGVGWLLVPQLVETCESLIAELPGFFSRTQAVITQFLNDNPEILQWLEANTDFESLNWQELIQKAVTVITNGFSAVVDTAVGAVVGLGNGIFNAVLSLVFGLYCLTRKEILERQGKRILYSIVPENIADEGVRILGMTNTAFSNFISGQCLEALILGCMFVVSMLIFKMPYMPLVSVVITITALVPIVGAFVGCGVGAFFILVQDPVMAFWFVIMFLILQQIEGNLIYPKVVGTSIGLPGMWVLVAVAVGGDLMGVAGMLIMIPLASVLYALAREFTDKRLAAKGIDPSKLQAAPPQKPPIFRKKKKKQSQEEEKPDSQTENG